MAFPSDFVWGAATAAYQIEGAVDVDGRSPSVWDAFSAHPGKTHNGDTGRVACDHYHHYREDVALMKEIGLEAYRFSVAWPRVLPNGRGAVNQKGLDFYSRLVDSLLEAGIDPWVTLYHWDLPLALHHEGGWMNPAITDAFAEYAGVMAHALGDRVKNWMTFNEPQCFLGFGLYQGYHAPGLKLPDVDFITALHYYQLAHGKAVSALRAVGGDRFRIGVVPTTQAVIPADENPETIAACKADFFAFNPPAGSMWSLSCYVDPMFFGTYPEDFLTAHGKNLPAGWEANMSTIAQPIDFCGINLYSGMRFRKTATGIEHVHPEPGNPRTAIKWNVEPETLRWAPRFLYERYRKPVVIAENGLSLSDWVFRDGKVHDPARIDFTARYLLELEKAIADGADVAAYFHWSLMDNFEWAEGYKERFGLIHVDYTTQKRTVKDSGYWYRDVIRSNGKSLH
jgi:beta-glucosidase